MKPVACHDCGQTWKRDPALEVPCPCCGADVGHGCRRPSGHNCEFHAERLQATLDAGFEDMCAAGPTAQRGQMALAL